MNQDRPLLAHRDRIDRVRFVPFDGDVSASVVVVTYQVDRGDFERVLDALAAQTTDAFELLVVDNGTDWNVERAVASHDRGRMYVRLRRNDGVTFARNLGATLATAPVLVYLDDDAIPETDFVEQHLDAHRDPDVVAVRGKVEPITDTLYNRMQQHRDIGVESVPYVIDIEGNTSFDRETFLAFDGYSERLDGRAGHEGPELTYRMVAGGVDPDAIRYHPGPVIYHDYCTSLSEFLYKRIMNERAARILRRNHPDLFAFVEGFEDRRGIDDPDLLERSLAFAVSVSADVVARAWNASASR